MKWLFLILLVLAMACSAPMDGGSAALSIFDGAISSDGDFEGTVDDGDVGSSDAGSLGGPGSDGHSSDQGDLGNSVGDGTPEDAGLDGTDEGLDNGGGGPIRGDSPCSADSPDLLEAGYGTPFLPFESGEVIAIELGSDGGASVLFSLRLNGDAREMDSWAELTDDLSGEVLAALQPVGMPSCLGDEWILRRVLMAISPSVDPFELIDRSANLVVHFEMGIDDGLAVLDLDLPVFLELATD